MNGRPTFGKDPKNGGGIFQIKTLEYSYAEFYFFGWNKDISRNSKQVIEVRKGENGDIRIAVVRKMIGIIREHETGEFLWESHRLGRQLTLSARARDNAELEILHDAGVLLRRAQSTLILIRIKGCGEARFSRHASCRSI